MKLLISALTVFLIASANAQIRIIEVVPSTNAITIKNFGFSTVDVSNYRLCSRIRYTSNLSTGITINSGSLNLAAGAEVEINARAGASSTWQGLQSAADLGLYLPSGAFSSSSAMVDFTQWGSGGHGRESVAAAKGIWTPGEFISGNEPYTYLGNGSQNGANFWTGAIPNNDPFGLSITSDAIDENQPLGTLIGNLSTIDADPGDTHTYSLIAGTGDTDNAQFQISGSSLQSNAVFDFESKNSYSIRIQTDDGNGGLFDMG